MATFFRADGWVKSVQGQAIAGAQVYICTQPADFAFLPPIPLASIFTDPQGLSPITQPLITDGFGHFDYYAASGTPYTEVVVNGGKVQAAYQDQIPMGATLGSSLPPFPGNPSVFLDGSGAFSTPAGAGTVTHTGSLTSGQLVTGNGGADIMTGPVFPGDPTKFLNGNGVFSVPAGGGSGTVTNTGNLTANALVVGNGTVDEKVLTSLGTTTTVLHGNAAGLPSFGAVVEADITLANNVTNNVSITAHGFAPILPNDATRYLDGTGSYTVPAGGGGINVNGSSVSAPNLQDSATVTFGVSGSNIQATASGGGGGGVPVGMSLLTPLVINANTAAYIGTMAGYSICLKIPGKSLLCAPTAVKVGLYLNQSGNYTLTAGVIWKAALGSTTGSTILASTPILWGGSAAPVLSGGPGRVMSDSVSVTFDPGYDWYAVISISGASAVDDLGMYYNSPPQVEYTGGRAYGDRTADATVPAFTGYNILDRVLAA